MTEEQKKQALLEERYAYLRSEVRQSYDVFRFATEQLTFNNNQIQKLEAEEENIVAKKRWFNAGKTLAALDANLQEQSIRKERVTQLQIGMETLRNYVELLAEEINELAGIIGVERVEELYGTEGEWWKR